MAIIWRVISVVIFSVNAHFWRALAHIGKEVFKAVPSRANLNPPAAVIFKRLALRIAAAFPHALPNRVSSGFIRHTVGCGKALYLFCRDLLFQAPARPAAPDYELIGSNRSLGSALAPAQAVVVFCFRLLQNKPAPKGLADHYRHHLGIINKPLFFVKSGYYHG